jgi:hypothetical protein
MNKLMTTTVTLAAGAILSAAVILACGNGSPGDADAAACDCPEAEPPLAGRIQVVEDVRNLGTAGGQSAAVLCESAAGAADWTLLGGGCIVDDDNDGDLILYQAGPIPFSESNSTLGGYDCLWRNPTSITIDAVKAYAICLVPAED